ncbi:PAS domain-containing sensor histidine kinase [Sulfurimonas sp. MAG313]|nr:PAS domain-containing sensor histidine kinase [Sulfurimonas sp. MAG313]MDF1882143.1 PAS domain-containing sensor histidine kinase [Sulfurimonas sp. MAG313]
MKQYELVYTDEKSLHSFIQINDLYTQSLVQILTSDQKLSNEIKIKLESISQEINIQIVVLNNESSTKLNFTKLSNLSNNQTSASEFDFFHSGPVVIFKRIPKDDCWIVSHVTQSVEQWGYKPSYFIDNNEAMKTVFYKDDMKRARDTLIESIEKGDNKLNQQYRINKTDGSLAWISEYTQIVRNKNSEPIALIGYLVDITLDKEREVLYSSIINTTTEGFWLLDDNLKIIDVNYSLCAMLGYTKDEMIGKKPLDFIIDEDHKFCQAQVESIKDTSSRIYEISYKTKNNAVLQTLSNATTMHDESGTVQTFAFMTDISKQKKIEGDLRKKQDAIKELNNSLESKISQEVQKNREKDQMMYQQSRLASMGEMIGNIAHQWRQPLNIMALVMQDLYISDQLGNLTSKKVEDSYEKSNNLLQYMSQTIDDFRNFFQHGSEELPFSVKEVVDSVHSLIGTNLNYHHIECEIKVVHDSIVKGGLNEFKQVIINILNNAQEAIESNPSSNNMIVIKISQEKNQALVSIRDDGGGISKDVIQKIFDPYFTTKNQTQGTGLGLYMSKQIIENSMCGSLNVKNIKNGAEFIISLPLEK